MDELEEKKVEEKYTKLTLNSITHELRTPLNGIVGSLNLLKELQLDKEGEEHVANASDSCELIHFLIDDVADFMLLKARGELILHKDVFQVQSTVTGVSQLFRLAIAQKALRLEFNTAAKIPSALEADQRRYQQILCNLLANAIKYTKQGGITIHLEYKMESGTLITAVEDTGPGIDPANFGRLFRLFGNKDSGALSSFQPQGLGLGLAVCKGLAEQLGGGIEVASTVGQGSKFTFSILAADASDLPTPRVSSPLRLPSRQKEKVGPSANSSAFSVDIEPSQGPSKRYCKCRHLLCVDDNEMNKHVITSFARKLGLCCDLASDGSEALERIREKALNECCSEYKLVLMDINMPIMDGPTATKQLLQLISTKELRPFPIVAFTAVVGSVDAKVYTQIGFTDIVNKPLRLDQFASLMKAYNIV